MCKLGKIQEEIKEIERTLLKGYEEIMRGRGIIDKADVGRVKVMRRLVMLRKQERDLLEKE